MVLAMGGLVMSNYIVGVTGGIGSGKTTVTNAFSELGIDVIDADVIAREVVEPGSEALAIIAEHFGNEILLDDGSLDRARLRELVFSNEANKAWLNQLLHPRIRSAIESQLDAATSPYALLSAPLLLENKLTYLTDRVLVIDVTEDTQLARTATRDGNSEAQIKAIMAAQMNRSQRLEAADDVLNNDGSLTDVYDQVAILHQRYLALSHKADTPSDSK